MYRTFTLLLLFPAILHSLAQSDSTTAFKIKANRGPYNQIGSVVAPVKMNVLYIGVDNPLDIAVPGVAAKDVTAAISNGSIKKISDGHFVANVTTAGKVLVVVMVKGKEASRHEFRVKRIPDPDIAINSLNYKSKAIKSDSLKKMTGVAPFLKSFDFDAPFKIQRFQFIYEAEGRKQSMPCTGEVFTPAMRDLLKKAKPGDMLTLDDIYISGPVGQSRRIEKLVYVVM